MTAVGDGYRPFIEAALRVARDEVREVEATLQRRVARLLVPAAVGEETVAGITRDEDLTHARVWVGSPEEIGRAHV